MKKTIIILASASVLGLAAYKLYANKEEMKENAKLSEITSASIPVQITQPEKLALNTRVSADGTFEAKTDLTILSETQGKLVAVYKEKGVTVRKGDLLAQVDNELLRTQVAAARANFEKLQSDSARFTKLSESDAVTQRQLEDVRIGLMNARAQYRQVQKQLDNTYIRATTSGIINDDFVQEGAYISPGMQLYNIVDISKLKLNVRLTANEILNVIEGDEINITSSVYPEDTFNGKVTAIAAKADGALKYNVEITLTNNSLRALKPGMYATAHFLFNSENEVLYLDRNAIIGSVQNPQVFTIVDGKAHLKSITIGEVRSDRVEVLDGLSTSNEVITTGQINLEEGTVVNALNRQ